LAFRLPIVIRGVDYGETVNLVLKSESTAYDTGYLRLAEHLDAELIRLNVKLGKIAEEMQGRKTSD